MNKKIICVILAFLLVLTTFVSCKKESNKNNSDTTNPTVIEKVTDADGEVVTDTAGNVVTEIYEEVPVTDNRGEQVTSNNGEKLTERIPHTTENKATTSTKASIISAILNTTKNNSQSSTAAAINTTRPVKSETSSDKNTEVPGTTADNKTEEKTTAQTTKPTTTKPTTTKPVTTKPTTTRPTTTKPTTTKPTTTTQPQIDLKAVANELAAYAKEYGLSIGLVYDYEGHKDNPYNGWTTPMGIVDDDMEYYKKRIRSKLNGIKNDYSLSYGEAKFWVQVAISDWDGDYELYIGY